MKLKSMTKCPPRTAVAYARYSSAGQRDVSIDQQLKDIHAFADREGYRVIHEYADHARSGFKDLSARAAFNAMIAAAAAGDFDTVLCWKVDRFGRDRAVSATMKQQLARLGVSIIYVMEPIPAGAAGVLTEGMLEAIAEWYSRNLSENVTRGMLDNAMKCLHNGTKVLGYTRGPDNRYQIVPDEAATVRHIFSRYISGYSAASICGDLNASGLRSSRGVAFTPQTLLRLIGNERYCGVYIWGSIRIPDGMPAIISRSDWEAAQAMKQKTSRHVEQHAVDFLLTGKAFCGHCEKAMIGDSGTSRNGTVHYYYTCQGHKSRSGCAKKNIRKEALEDFVVNFIFDYCLTEEQMESTADIVMKEMEERKKKSPLQSMKQQLSDLEKKISNINHAIADGIYSASTLDLLRGYEETANDLRKDVGLLEYQESQMMSRDRLLFFLHKFAGMNRDNPEHRRKLINMFINAVYVYDDGTVKIVTNTTEGTKTLPLQSIPDAPPCSDCVTSGVLLGTHPNQILFWYVTRM